MIDWEFPLFMLGLILAGILIIIGMLFVNIKYIENVPIRVYVENKIVYEGISAGVDVGSVGANTKVQIKKGFLYLFPKSYYVSPDVKIVNIRDVKDIKDVEDMKFTYPQPYGGSGYFIKQMLSEREGGENEIRFK